MHNDEICSVTMCLLYTLCMCGNKQPHSSSSSWSGCNWEAAAEADGVGAQIDLTTWD